MQFSPLAHAALDPRWDGHLLKFNHRGDIADANGEVDPDRIPEAPQPECPTGGCARDRAKAEAAKEEL